MSEPPTDWDKVLAPVRQQAKDLAAAAGLPPPHAQAALPLPLDWTAVRTCCAFASIATPVVELPYSPISTGTVPLAPVICWLAEISWARFCDTVA